MSDAWVERLKKVESPDATYGDFDPAVVFDVANGSLIRSVDGREYIDLCAGFGALPFGHNSEDLRAVMASRASEGFVPVTHGMGDVFASRAKIEFLEALVGALPDHLEQVSLALTGSGAVEAAVKTAVLATEKSGFIVFEHGYHGVELGIVNLSAREDFRAPFAGLTHANAVVRIPYHAPDDVVAEGIRKLAASSHGFAGILVEPILGRGGVQPASLGWLSSLRELAAQHGGLMIFDEVFVGMGRSGRLTFADEVPADLICLGKALGGGLPLSACVGRAEVMSAWPQSRGEAIHTGTFYGHPLSCELGLRTIRRLIAENWAARNQIRGHQLRETWRQLLAGCRAVREIRGEGWMIGICLDKPGAGVAVVDDLRSQGVIALPSGPRGEVVSMTPAYNLPESLQERVSEALLTSLMRV